MVEHPAVLAYKQRLLQAYPERLRRFIIFGSYARGEHTAESDIDVFVTLSGPISTEDEVNIYNHAFDMDIEFDVIFDVKIFSEEEIQNTLLRAMPLVENVLKEGVTV